MGPARRRLLFAVLPTGIALNNTDFTIVKGGTPVEPNLQRILGQRWR
jgi:hypothetical protein